MNSGLSVVVLINIVTSWLCILIYRYVIMREAGLLSPKEVALLRKYPSVRSAQHYTPSDAFVRAPPPMRWTGWHDFFTAGDSALSRDAQVYLLFQRGCILTTAICALFAGILLLPSYWFGGAVFGTEGDSQPSSLMSLLKSDRGVFERFTSHNLPEDSPLFVLQLPVFVVTAMCIVVLYTVVKAAAGEERSVAEWLYKGSSHSQPNLNSYVSFGSTKDSMRSAKAKRVRGSAARKRYWTLFARGIPMSIQSADELLEMLEALYPGHVANVELVCKGRTSEARLLRSLSSARNRLDYLHEAEEDSLDVRLAPGSLFGRVFSKFAKKRTKQEMIEALEEKISTLERDEARRKVEPVRDFLGCAFISFTSSAAAASALRDFPVKIVAAPSANASSSSLTEIGDQGTLDLTLGRHTRMSSDWGVGGLKNLYRGTVNLLPYSIRQRILHSQNFAPSTLREERRSHERLLETFFIDQSMTAEIATSRLRNMKAERAPKSGDIIWRNVGISFFERTVREMIVQVIVFAILILFTSPVAMLTALKLVFAELSLLSDPSMIFGAGGDHNTTSNPIFDETDGFSLFNFQDGDGDAAEVISTYFLDLLPSFLKSNTLLRAALLAYLPVLMLAIIFAAVPSILRLTCALEGYPTHSSMEMSVFRKTAFYYVMNAVVLPSLALNTASEFLEMLYKQSDGGANVYNALPILQRLFSGDIAFFLCNYLVQLALTGSVIWLMRIPSSFSMMVRRRIAVTPLEAAEAKCTDIFDYPRHYAYGVTVMSMCLLFGFMAPLIWWFALLYFVCKHLVDTYVLRYVHPRSHIDGRLPRLSSNFILTWTAVSQLSLAVMFYLQGWVRAGFATGFLCILTLACCLSVSATVGNRIMRIIAGLRDKAVSRLMTIGGEGSEWLRPPSLITSPSHSSTNSLSEPTEGDPLLQDSGESEDDLVNRMWSEDIPKELESQEKHRRLERRYIPAGSGDLAFSTAEEPEGYESNYEDDNIIMRTDIEDARANLILDYGAVKIERRNDDRIL